LAFYSTFINNPLLSYNPLNGKDDGLLAPMGACDAVGLWPLRRACGWAGGECQGELCVCAPGWGRLGDFRTDAEEGACDKHATALAALYLVQALAFWSAAAHAASLLWRVRRADADSPLRKARDFTAVVLASAAGFALEASLRAQDPLAHGLGLTAFYSFLQGVGLWGALVSTWMFVAILARMVEKSLDSGLGPPSSGVYLARFRRYKMPMIALGFLLSFSPVAACWLTKEYSLAFGSAFYALTSAYLTVGGVVMLPITFLAEHDLSAFLALSGTQLAHSATVESGGAEVTDRVQALLDRAINMRVSAMIFVAPVIIITAVYPFVPLLVGFASYQLPLANTQMALVMHKSLRMFPAKGRVVPKPPRSLHATNSPTKLISLSPSKPPVTSIKPGTALPESLSSHNA
jgi:hypothetical protein